MKESTEKSRTPVSWVVKAVLAILWVFAITAGYFWAHKPFDFALLAGLAKTLLSIIIWVGVTALAAALGRVVFGRALTAESPLARLTLATGAGLGFISLIMMGLSVVGLISQVTAWGLVLILAVLLRKPLRATVADVGALRLPRPQDNWQRWWLLYGGAALLLTFLIALTPVIAWDSLVYHLTGPRIYMEAGRIVHPIDLPYLGFPLLGQMQFMLGMLLFSDRVAALFHFGYGVLALAATVLLARRAFGRQAGWYAGVVLLSVPTLFTLMAWPYVDIALLFYATAALYSFLRWREEREGKTAVIWLVLIGLFSGFGGGLKYTAVTVPFAIGLCLVWESRRDGLRAVVTRLALVAAVAVVVVLPWPLENWATTGNPVYPFFLDNALHWDTWRGWWYDRPGTGYAATEPWRLLIVPFEATIIGTEGTNFYEATIGPLLLVGGGLLLLVWPAVRRNEKTPVAYLGVFFFASYLLWLNGVARTALLLRARFLFPVFGAAAAISGLAFARIDHLRRPQLAVDWIVRVTLAGILVLLLFNEVHDFLWFNPLPVLAGVETEDAYLQRTLGPYRQAINAINELPDEAQVQFLWEPRSYRCHVDCRPDALLDHFLHLTHALELDATGVSAHWREQGATHVLLHQAGFERVVAAGFDPVTAQDQAILARLQTDYLQPVQRWGDDYVLYELR